jgi:hypothetical protein
MVFLDTIERVKAMKFLRTWLQENLKWNDHVTKLTSSCYAVLFTLQKIKNISPLAIKKQLVELLILSKLDYNDTSKP